MNSRAMTAAEKQANYRKRKEKKFMAIDNELYAWNQVLKVAISLGVIHPGCTGQEAANYLKSYLLQLERIPGVSKEIVFPTF